jgi:hypothetical protein
MRAAPPPVEFPLGSGRRERVVVALLYALAGAALVAWLAPRAGAQVPAWAVIGVAATAALVGWCLLSPMQGRLAWDGAGWSHLQAPGSMRRPMDAVHLQIDVGPWLLLRVQRPGHRASGWCGLSAADVGAAWHGARLALYYRPRPTLPAGL